jgi:serine/threonine protein phosphatase 1
MSELRKAIPDRHVKFLRGLIDTFRFGDYLFVHAGIRPGIDLGEQSQLDLRWIRAAFLEDRTDHGFMVIHGHTISEEVDERPNRIGIDTGAYWSGVLSAIGLEGSDRWYLSTDATRTERKATQVD